MNISTRRLLTSITRKIGGFFVCKKFFQEILKKHPPKTPSHFKQVKGLIPNHKKVSPFTCILTTEYSSIIKGFSENNLVIQKRQSVRVAFCNT